MNIFEAIKDNTWLGALEWLELPEAQMPTITYRGNDKIVYVIDAGSGIKIMVSSETFSVDYEYYGDLDNHSHVIETLLNFLSNDSFKEIGP